MEPAGISARTGQSSSAWLIAELAKLCWLGIMKEVVKGRLRAQVLWRRAIKAKGISKGPHLQPIDVHAVIAENKCIAAGTECKAPENDPSYKFTSSKKRKPSDQAADADPDITSQNLDPGDPDSVSNSTGGSRPNSPTGACSPHPD